MRLAFSRCLFAAAAAALAVLCLAYGGFGPAAQALPGWIPLQKICVSLSALVLLAAGAGLCIPKMASVSARAIGAYYAVWAALGLPAIASHPLSIGAWYGFCEATTSLVGAWVLWAALKCEPGAPTPFDCGVRIARAVFGLTCAFYGVSHFVYADYTAGMVPAWLPYRLALAYLTGIAHVAAGAGVTFGILPRIAATLEALMMSLFGLLVWVPSFWAHPRPQWATPPENQWSELVVTFVLAASVWVVAASLGWDCGASSSGRAPS
jgi:uncharacterized membrane protein